MEEKTGRPIRPDYCPSLKKKIVTKHPNNHITKANKTRRQNKELCSKERNYTLETAPLPRARGKLGGM